MAKKTITYISCGIFKEELEYLLKAKGLNWKIIYLEAALHVNFSRLKEALLGPEEIRRLNKEGKAFFLSAGLGSHLA